MSNSATTGVPAESSDARDQPAQVMLRRSLTTTRLVMAKLLPYYFMYFVAIRYIEEQKSASRRDSSMDPYPWWEEQQCVPDSDSFLSDIEKSVKDQLEVGGWLLERGEQDVLLDSFTPDLEAIFIAQLYISAVEDWLRREVKDADDITPLDGDVDP